MSSTYVLVHGAWHGGWCYSRVAEHLRAAGHRVFTPTLTGLGERSHLRSGTIDLDTHILDVRNLIHWESLERVILVGHSYGGMVITGVADAMPERIETLIYLDAFMPANNQSLHDLLPPDNAKAQRDSATASNGYCVPPMPAARFQVNPGDRPWVDALCTPQPLATFTQRLRIEGGIEHVPSNVYVLATAGNAPFRRFRDAVASSPRWQTRELPCGHDVMIDLPAETAAILSESRVGSP